MLPTRLWQDTSQHRTALAVALVQGRWSMLQWHVFFDALIEAGMPCTVHVVMELEEPRRRGRRWRDLRQMVRDEDWCGLHLYEVRAEHGLLEGWIVPWMPRFTIV